MNSKRVQVPIRVVRQETEAKPRSMRFASVEEARPAIEECPETAINSDDVAADEPIEENEMEETETQSDVSLEEELEAWRDRALRLEAEIDNFRKRQRRVAEDRIAAERERLLRAFLSVGDDLSRALTVEAADAASLREGVAVTQQSLVRLLDQEGVETVQTDGARFDPHWHEAVGTIPSHKSGSRPDAIVEVIQPGYRLGERLLRPARVIVAR